MANSFETLVAALREKLGPCSGIGSEDVDTEELQSLMAQYTSNECEWEKYKFEKSNLPYTRNLVDKGNGKSNLLILVWTPGKASPVHDHANAHCIMKILKGRLKETRYHWPTVQLNQNEESPLVVKRKTVYSKDEVTYMSDKLGLHKISNPHSSEFAVSLHLYTPPNAAVYGCNIFNEKTGHASHLPRCTFYSEYGSKARG
ncbi:cysteine dioxygenase type I [Aaosphaeria arxii CBS 175.79]|uniref:Cysteine dioxygenase n=1 Tax=Aaosphaeria arxii CBS 175.79 TaxID=1450172 RepID=A0A6A5X8G5_9PLEO|nr:cysteine dioxygenase type I [Aaosphaeria arxii CBS 175.79]KAF2009189.1 cysteine dioxygenase type I [Aaosphaeria arxii CBS 175.79]